MDLITCAENYIKIVDCGGLTPVMHQTNIPVSVLSKQLTWLEQYAGATLIQRSTRRMQVTEAGLVFYEEMKKVLAAKENAISAIRGLDEEPHGVIRFGGAGAIFRTVYLDYIQAFLTQHPKIKIKFVNTLSPFSVLDDEVDVIISKYQIHENNLICHWLSECDTHVYASPGYLKKHGTPKTILELPGHNCLCNTEIKPCGFWRFANGQTVKVHGNFGCSNSGILVRAAVKGLGLVYVSDRIVCQETEAHLLKKLKLDVEGHTISTYLYHLWCEPTSPIRVFADFMLKQFETGVSR